MNELLVLHRNFYDHFWHSNSYIHRINKILHIILLVFCNIIEYLFRNCLETVMKKKMLVQGITFFYLLSVRTLFTEAIKNELILKLKSSFFRSVIRSSL